MAKAKQAATPVVEKKIMTLDSISNIAKMYYNLILKDSFTIEMVNDKYKEEVQFLIDNDNQ